MDPCASPDPLNLLLFLVSKNLDRFLSRGEPPQHLREPKTRGLWTASRRGTLPPLRRQMCTVGSNMEGEELSCSPGDQKPGQHQAGELPGGDAKPARVCGFLLFLQTYLSHAWVSPTSWRLNPQQPRPSSFRVHLKTLPLCQGSTHITGALSISVLSTSLPGLFSPERPPSYLPHGGRPLADDLQACFRQSQYVSKLALNSWSSSSFFPNWDSSSQRALPRFLPSPEARPFISQA